MCACGPLEEGLGQAESPSQRGREQEGIAGLLPPREGGCKGSNEAKGPKENCEPWKAKHATQWGSEGVPHNQKHVYQNHWHVQVQYEPHLL
jgi:hypothetical protein